DFCVGDSRQVDRDDVAVAPDRHRLVSTAPTAVAMVTPDAGHSYRKAFVLRGGRRGRRGVVLGGGPQQLLHGHDEIPASVTYRHGSLQHGLLLLQDRPARGSVAAVRAASTS